MQPLSFDPETARELTGDGLAREIEAQARADADAMTYSPPKVEGDSYWSQVQAQMRSIVYQVQYRKRLARNDRRSRPRP